jgi:hypothetical protein
MVSGQPCGNFSQGDNGRTRDKVAAYTGTSGRTLEKAIKIATAIEQHPELVSLNSGMNFGVNFGVKLFKTGWDTMV